MTLVTTPDSVQVNARWAPITSLSSRLTRAPVRVRVKKAIGIRCTWENTARRRSRISPSPMRDDCHRSAIPTAASSTASTAMTSARRTTVPSPRPSMMASTTWPASTGLATVRTAPTTLRARKAASLRRCGRAKAQMRPSVALVNARRGRSVCMALSRAIQWPNPMSIRSSSWLSGPPMGRLGKSATSS